VFQYIGLQCYDAHLRLLQEFDNVPLPPVINPRDVVLQRSIITIFRGLTDRHLRGVLSISRYETALQICLRNATMCPLGLLVS